MYLLSFFFGFFFEFYDLLFPVHALIQTLHGISPYHIDH